MKVASFFSGIGGIDLGLERAGMEVVFQCEILPFGQSVLKKHWPDAILAGDITKVQGNDIPTVDVFAGGFPCQDLCSKRTLTWMKPTECLRKRKNLAMKKN